MHTLVVAVDGVLADTLAMRTAALQHALREIGLDLEVPASDGWIAGRDWAGAARALHGDAGAAHEGTVDLVTFAAERALHAQLAEGAPTVFPDALVRCGEAAAQGWRVILRTDNSRRAAGAVLEHLLRETNATRAIAADDVRTASAGVSMLHRQYAQLAPTLRSAHVCHVVEVSPVALAAARELRPDLQIGWPVR